MIFERFYKWNEEKLGLLGGLGFVFIGVFAYLIYRLELSGNAGWVPVLITLLLIALSAVTALFYQLPRIKGVRGAISSFAGTIILGLTVVLWVWNMSIVYHANYNNLLLILEVALLSAGLLISAFFGFGFFFIAIIPPYKPIKKRKKVKVPKKKKAKVEKEPVGEMKEEVDEEIEEDFIDRL